MRNKTDWLIYSQICGAAEEEFLGLTLLISVKLNGRAGRQHWATETVSTYHELMFLLVGLEASVTKLTGRINELELDFLHRTSACLSQQRLMTSQHTTQRLMTSQQLTQRLMTSQQHRDWWHHNTQRLMTSQQHRDWWHHNNTETDDITTTQRLMTSQQHRDWW